MRCKDVEKLLPGYLENNLRAEEKARISFHLSRCPACTGCLELLKRTDAALAGIGDLDPGPALMARLQAVPSTAAPRRRFSVFVFKPAIQPVLAGAFLVTAFIAVLAFTPVGGRMIKTLNRQMHAGYSKITRLYARAESIADSLGGAREQVIVSLENLPPLGGDQR
ncbi:MAG: zf-HC2 domain-containing protein [Candidatus Aminicenantes bacterium]|nr:zf-HC2 domain-containing protein [Candidatus Aminicenantes bacterium]